MLPGPGQDEESCMQSCADEARTGDCGRAASWVGLGVALLLVGLAVALPQLTEWQVYSHANPGAEDVPPLHSLWEPKLGPGTLPAVAIAALGWRYARAWSEHLPWPRLLAVVCVAGLAWLLALACVDGSAGISRVLGNPYEYLETARATDDVSAMLHDYVDRIPYAAPDNWVTHVAGHPPGALLFFVVLDRLSLAGDLSAGLIVTSLAASTPIAVLVTLRALGAEVSARRAAPFLVLGPAAVWTAVSADALFAAVAAWGLATLALAAASRRRDVMVAWSALAGGLLGYCVMMSYGLPLLGLLAVAVLVAARAWEPFVMAALSATTVVLAFAAGGFALWEAFPVLHERYWDGVAADRPAAYWMWANLAALVLCGGPLLGAGLARLAVRRCEAERAVVLLVGAAVIAIAIADLSRMSKGEVERIWLPFVHWLLLSTALLPERWRQSGLALQIGVALALQHLLYTSW
jgi:hypothetical protein